VVREDGLLKLVMVGRMDSKGPRGRPRISMMDDIMMGSCEHMKRRALQSIQRVRGFGCQQPAMRQRTDDDS